jgi:hypothetical protein
VRHLQSLAAAYSSGDFLIAHRTPGQQQHENQKLLHLLPLFAAPALNAADNRNIAIQVFRLYAMEIPKSVFNAHIKAKGTPTSAASTSGNRRTTIVAVFTSTLL